MDVVVVIPAFNEEGTLGSVIAAMDSSWDIVVIDDGSRDNTARIAQAGGALVVRHDGNRGYDWALKTGLDYARDAGYRIAITIDADGQISADLVKIALMRMEEGADLVLGRRSFQARWAERIFSAYARYRYGVSDILCGLKAYRLTCFEFLSEFSMNNSIGTAVALAGLRQGLHWAEIEVPIRLRKDSSRFGSGLWGNWKILKGMWNAILFDFGRS